MKNYILFLILLYFKGFSQDTIKSSIKLDSIKKYELIYSYLTVTQSFTNYETQSGKKKGSTSARGIFIDFRVGLEGPIKNIGRRGKSLEKIIKNDAEAYKEFNIAYKVHLRKKRIFNTLEYFGYVIAAGSAVALFIGADNYETDGITGLAIAGGAGVVIGFVDILGFHKLTDNEMDKFSASIQKAINIYNNNLITKTK
jgi:hypothetical protein